MKASSALRAVAVVAACGSVLAGVGDFVWDTRRNPESANNMCFQLYCLGGNPELTYGGGGRGNRGTLSGQNNQPVTNAAKYGLNPLPHANSFSYVNSDGQVLQVINEAVTVTDEWPPASASNGGRAASLRGTTGTDSRLQAGMVKEMWAARDMTSNKVRVTPSQYNYGAVRHLLPYCFCAGKTGEDLERCCRNDGNQIQKDPDEQGPGGAAKFFKVDFPRHFISPGKPAKRDDALSISLANNGTQSMEEGKRSETFVA